MPIDPNMALMQYGMGMAGPRMAGQPAPVFGQGMMGAQASPFDRTNQPRQWWQQQPPPQPQQRPDDSNTPQPANQPKRPPSLLDMVMGLGKMTRPEYDKTIQGQGAYGISPQTAAAAGPWAFLGSMGLPGGLGWGGGQSGGQ